MYRKSGLRKTDMISSDVKTGCRDSEVRLYLLSGINTETMNLKYRDNLINQYNAAKKSMVDQLQLKLV